MSQLLEMSFTGNKSNRKRFEKFVAFNKEEAIQNIKSNSIINFVSEENKEQILEEFNKKIEQIQKKEGIIKGDEKKSEYKEKDPYDYDVLDISGVESNFVTCNTPGCGQKIWFDKRCVHKTLRNQQTGKRSLVTLESPYQLGMPKPRRHYCIRNQYINKNQIPFAEALGHILLHQDKDHCNICLEFSFWLAYHLKEHPEKRKLKGRWYNN